MTRTSGVAALVLIAGCSTPAAQVTAQPSPVVLITGTVVPPSPLARATPTRKASRSRHGLPTILLRIRSCESGANGYATHGWAFDANYTETNPRSTASGAWQALDGTWGRFRGYRRAKDAPPAVQDAFALELYAAEGTTPWNASRDCWGAA